MISSLFFLDLKDMSYQSEDYGMGEPREGMCYCGIPIASLVSWTPKKPGRRFKRCNFYSKRTVEALRCGYWRWIDVG